MISIEDLGKRDNWLCWLCNQPVPQDVKRRSKLAATRDHVVPRSHGGPDTADNLRLAHRKCNQGRGNRQIRVPKQKSDWKKAMEERRHAREAIFNKIRGVA